MALRGKALLPMSSGRGAASRTVQPGCCYTWASTPSARRQRCCEQLHLYLHQPISAAQQRAGLATMLTSIISKMAVLLGLGRLYGPAFRAFMALVERDLVPDFLIRRGIRSLLAKRLDEVRHAESE